MTSTIAGTEAQATGAAERPEAGEEVIVTRFRKAPAEPAPSARRTAAEPRKAVLDAVGLRADRRDAGPGAARGRDFLHGAEGSPR